MKIRHKSFQLSSPEWFDDLSGKTARITAIGNRSLMVENHIGIEKYDSDCVCLHTRCGIIRVEGANLALREVRKDALIVSGTVHSVNLPCSDAP